MLLASWPHRLRAATPWRRFFSADAASHHANRTQVYVSKSHDPLVNLSVEHRLLQITPPESTVLLLYVNAPCVVFGRNQNPWLQANLRRLADIAKRPELVGWDDTPVKLVRRRSGGGTVFHDLGNVNFSVICPPAVFDRDKHAEMVVRALKSLGKQRTRVNVRHDIVMDVDDSVFKVSGSAYKLTRQRSLHHGTCLLASPNLSKISGLLRSPAEPFIKGRGVESVRSPVNNLGLQNGEFIDAVVGEFADMYGAFDISSEFDDTALKDDKVMQGFRELQSREWIYGQTPQFTLCTHAFDDDPRERPELPFNHMLHFEARHGVIGKFSIDSEPDLDESLLIKQDLHEVADWTSRLAQAGMPDADAQQVGSWLDETLGTDFTQIPSPATF